MCPRLHIYFIKNTPDVSSPLLLMRPKHQNPVTPLTWLILVYGHRIRRSMPSADGTHYAINFKPPFDCRQRTRIGDTGPLFAIIRLGKIHTKTQVTAECDLKLCRELSGPPFALATPNLFVRTRHIVSSAHIPFPWYIFLFGWVIINGKAI